MRHHSITTIGLHNIPVSNLSCLSIMFPRHDQDYTVFENPMYNNLQITINGRNVPDEVVDTTDARFLHYQLVASDIDCIAFNALKSMKIQ